MKEQKHIDRLFQERFKEFDVNPPAEVWKNIEAELRKKEKEDRKLIPIWWRVAGVAALFAILFTVGSSIFSTDPTTNSVTQEGPDQLEQQTPNEVIETVVPKASTNTIADTNTEEASDAQEQTTINNRLDANSNTQAVAASNSTEQVNKESESNKTNYKFNTGYTADPIAADVTGVTTAAGTSNTSSTEGTSSDQSTKTNPTDTEVIDKDALEGLVQDAATADAVTTNTTENQSTTQNNTDTDITDSEETQTGKVSLIAYLENKEQEDAVADLETESLPDNRWSLAPQIAPVFYGSLADGSSINNEFNDNTKTSDANVSYGVQVQYNVNDRFAIRSGVSKVNLSYNTNDIEFAVTPATASLGGSKFNSGSVVYSVADKGTLANQVTQAMPTDGLTPITINAFEGLLTQQLEYWEVPLEASYALVNNRFKLNVVGGLSTLFLQDNSLTAISGDREANLGAVGNLNDLSFTTNVGLGFQYNISKSFAVNVEPMFKYQLNPYSDSSVNFRPFYMGVYSGLSFKF